MNAVVIGCGLIGHKRAEALMELGNIVGCLDLSQSRAEEFSSKFKCKKYDNLQDLLNLSYVDFVLVATTHNTLGEIALESLRKNKHVFLEKPGACSSKELVEVVDLARKNSLKLHIGFNHQFHPAILKMLEIIKNGGIGELMFTRVRYGHGGRIGYENEWRSKKALAGGGELIDQGSHILDLLLKLFENLKVSYAATPTYFWNMEVEDNAFMVLEDHKGRISFVHASCTEWKNLFSMEVYGEKGKIEISGLGRSYGLETLIHYKMSPQMGPPVATSFKFEEPDQSWKSELEQFIRDIKENTFESDNSESSIKVLEMIEEIYERTGR